MNYYDDEQYIEVAAARAKPIRESNNMGIRFLCEGEAIWMIQRNMPMPIPDVDERISINGITYLVNRREWIADLNGVHVTVYLSHLPINTPQTIR